MFGKQFKDEDTDHEAPVVKTFGDGISASTPDPEPAPEPEPEEQVKPIVGRRMITSEDQEEVKKKFKQLMGEDSEIPITCISCNVETYYHLISVLPKYKSEIRWQNLRLDYK
jgi:hypothetical protein